MSMAKHRSTRDPAADQATSGAAQAASGAGPATSGPVPPRSGAQPVPDPPWQQGRRKPAPRTPLSREAIADAALRVLDRHGLDGLSMRRVAGELGTGPGSLYWHVQNKEELLELLADRVMTEIELPPPDPSRWQEQVKELGRVTRQVMGSHRDAARITLGRVPVGPNLVRFAEWLLDLLRSAGVPDQAAAYAGDLFGLYVGAFAFEESLGFAPAGESMPIEQAVGMLRDYFASLPAERFPNVVALADLLVAGGPDERFEFGLDVLVGGIAAMATR
jgi:TetR/AcrR family tetracycline transcriptional repressor